MRSIPVRYWASFSCVGLISAATLFAISLTPSLLPRVAGQQGVLSGIALAVGYGLGVLIMGLWHYLELPELRGRARRVLQWLTALGVAVLVVTFLWRTTIWQNSVRGLMEMEPLEGTYRPKVIALALVIGAGLVAAGRLLLRLFGMVDRRLRRIVPRRVSNVLSVLIVGTVLILIVNGVIARFGLRVADAAFLQIDELDDEDEISRPLHDLSSGSAASLIPWRTIGRRGKEFIVAAPDEGDLEGFWGEPARQPIRVYVGLRSEDKAKDRAALALDELKRVGGFDRSILVVATPTGTGWLDPGAVHALEYLHAGDTAIVTMQYSYLPSWLTILVEPGRSVESAYALFDTIYDHWRELPEDDRPKLFLHGLSLGSLGSEACADLFTIFEAPIQGAVWSGPPFPSERWSALVADRNPESPVWLPEFRDGSMVRFTGRASSLDEAGRRWGPVRFVYIQHASDPMTFFSPSLLYRKPAWLVDERGPDVSPYLDWYPIVTFLQVAGDLPMAMTVPSGYGHNIAPASYIDAWIAVTQPEDWSDADTERLKQVLAGE